MLLRDRRAGGRDAVSRSHLVFIETDDAEASEQLASFAAAPDAARRLGLTRPSPRLLAATRQIGVPGLEHANRRLAYHLGGDPASVDAARILRPPAT